MLQCLIVHDSAGVMYWGDAGMHKIEKANLDGTGRTVLLTETQINAHYYAFVLHAGNIYFTDWRYAYGFLFTSVHRRRR